MNTIQKSLQKEEKKVYNIKEIKSYEALFLIWDNEQNRNFTILDVRSPKKYAQGHLHDAINFDISHPRFEDNISKLNRDKIYLVYSDTGFSGNRACEIMYNLGFRKTFNIVDGFEGWKNYKFTWVTEEHWC